MSTDGKPSAFGESLAYITQIKLQELETQRLTYKEHARVIEEASSLGPTNIGRVERLLKAVKEWPGFGASLSASELDLDNLELWLEQARADPGVAPEIVQRWGDALEAHIRRLGASFDYAKLFGQLFTDWLKSGDGSGESPAHDDGELGDQSDEFVEINRKEGVEQRAQLEALVFEKRTIDVAALNAYLDELFLSNRDSEKTLKSVRANAAKQGKRLMSSRISSNTLRTTIKSLLAEDLLNNEKRATLEEFSRNDTVLEEVASVLNMHLARIGTWEWPKEGVLIEMRRALNGKYRFFLDEELLTALFLHHLGASWEVFFKQQFRGFLRNAWKSAIPPTNKKTLDRRRTLLQETANDTTIESVRRSKREDSYFLAQLPNSMEDKEDYDNGTSKSGATSIKQELFDFLGTETLLNVTLHGSQTVLFSDLEWFGPSLRFDAIMTVMKYFGVPDEWLSFFHTFLAAPLRFKGDPAGATPRMRCCGVPISHRLATLFGETVLFVMDYAVNQKADGLFLHRIFDDLVLWSHDATKVLAGWKEMQRYADLVGLTINKEKTASTSLGGTKVAGLPTGEVRWGFLRLDPAKGAFVVDEKKIDEQIIELRRQLAATRSVFGLVNAYNTYIRFIARNLGGRPANVFGATHIDSMVSVLARVQREVYPGVEGGVIGHLRNLIRERYGVDNIPLGWFFFPNSVGGLGLHNPLVELLALKKDMVKDPVALLSKTKEEDEDRFRQLRENWENADNTQSRGKDDYDFDISLEEYIGGREQHLESWGEVYSQLLNIPDPHEVETSSEVDRALDAGTFYERWILAMFEGEMKTAFGSLSIVDPALIPVGMMGLFQQSKIRWEQ